MGTNNNPQWFDITSPVESLVPKFSDLLPSPQRSWEGRGSLICCDLSLPCGGLNHQTSSWPPLLHSWPQDCHYPRLALPRAWEKVLSPCNIITSLQATPKSSLALVIFIHSFTQHVFNKYLISSYHMPGIELKTGDAVENKTMMVTDFVEHIIQCSNYLPFPINFW